MTDCCNCNENVQATSVLKLLSMPQEAQSYPAMDLEEIKATFHNEVW